MISVQVRAASGETLRRTLSASVGNFFQADKAIYPMLVHIIPWADTAFNRSQISVLVTEIDRYEIDSSVNPSGESFAWLREMFQLAIEEPHRMIWFVGD
jgi:hypothetical protein